MTRPSGTTVLARALAAVALAWLAVPAIAEEPIVDHQKVPCALPSTFPRICCYLVDDGEVKNAKTYFRETGEERYYWVEMTFDGVQYCATLPMPSPRTRSVDYYVWVIDDEFLTNRTDDLRMVLQESCEYPVFDEDPQRTSEIVVHATIDRQRKLKGFEEEGVELVTQ